MLPFFLGGVALAATGYGVKKFFDDDENRDKLEDILIKGCDWIDEVDKKAEEFFDGLIEKFRTDEEQEHQFILLKKLNLTKYNTSRIIHSEIENMLNNLLKNFPKEEQTTVTKIYETNIAELLSTEENIHIVDEFCEILKNAKVYALQTILELKEPLIQTNDFTKLEKNVQETIVKLTDFKNLLVNADNCPITFDGVTISPVIKVCFERIKLVINH